MILKSCTVADVDSIISSEILDVQQDLVCYDNIVSKYMIHVPCGPLDKDGLCMKQKRRSLTIFYDNGFVYYISTVMSTHNLFLEMTSNLIITMLS